MWNAAVRLLSEPVSEEDIFELLHRRGWRARIQSLSARSLELSGELPALSPRRSLSPVLKVAGGISIAPQSSDKKSGKQKGD